ncbi:energy-coupling factor transporter transmembrane protein EcfT [Alteribacillus sp. JSM 102045]|uniref:energy-coupling factor transporter transmembrane component T family protein n=1 Tax=Alteribacillus sp. JSM 102045 TaxID=1562101 RepID=UPI0035BF7FC9
MAAYRFLPAFQQELQQIRTAHKIRGLGEERKWGNFKRYFIPLMASTIRKAERTAIAMESKGFDGSRDRQFYRQITWNRRDACFAALFVFVLAGVFLVRGSIS